MWGTEYQLRALAAGGRLFRDTDEAHWPSLMPRAFWLSDVQSARILLEQDTGYEILALAALCQVSGQAGPGSSQALYSPDCQLAGS